MKRPQITNVKTDGRNGGRVGLSCECGGAKYHIWLDPATKDVGDVLYKNPPRSVRLDSPGHFHTRKLSVSSEFSSALIAEMLRVYEERGLLAGLEAREAKEAAAAGAQRKADDVARQVQGLAPEMARFIAAMRCSYKALEAADEVCGHCLVCRVHALADKELNAPVR